MYAGLSNNPITTVDLFGQHTRKFTFDTPGWLLVFHYIYGLGWPLTIDGAWKKYMEAAPSLQGMAKQALLKKAQALKNIGQSGTKSYYANFHVEIAGDSQFTGYYLMNGSVPPDFEIRGTVTAKGYSGQVCAVSFQNLTYTFNDNINLNINPFQNFDWKDFHIFLALRGLRPGQWEIPYRLKVSWNESDTVEFLFFSKTQSLETIREYGGWPIQ